MASGVFPYRVVILSPREPWFSPILMAVPCSLQTFTSLENCEHAMSKSLWKFPGFIRTFSTTSAAAMAISDEKCTSATRGTSSPSARSLDLISANARTSAKVGTVSLIRPAPAAASRLHWLTEASISDVCVLHIVCTTMGCPPPMLTFPTLTSFVCMILLLLIYCRS